MSEQGKTQGADAALTPVVVKKYANRRLYNTESSTYITLDSLAEMVREGRDFVVYDAKSGEDITRSVLTQIIVEEEGKGSAMLPTGFLRQLIGFYGNSLQGLVPGYLDQAMQSFAAQQEQMQKAMQQTVGTFFPFPVGDVRQNLAMVETAMAMFKPFLPPQPGDAAPAQAAPAPAAKDDVETLKAELAAAKAELAAATAKKK